MWFEWHGSHLGCRNGMIIAILNIHVATMPPTKFGLNMTGFQSRCGFKIFKMATQVTIFISRTERFWQFWISMLLRCFPSSFSSIQLMVWEEMLFEEFQDGRHGGHLGYQKRTILAILNLYVTPISPIKFRLNPTYSQMVHVGDVVWRISRCRPWRPSWTTEWNDFSNSESLCASH